MPRSTFLYPLLLSSLLYCTLGQSVTQSPLNVLIGEGMAVPLSCGYDQTASTMYWYIQKPDHTIKMLLSNFNKDSDLEEGYRGRMFHSFDKTNKRFPLNITKIRMSDSGTYYCVFTRASGSWGKLTFGGGTRVYVTPRTERTIPSVYQLKADKSEGGLPKSVCLVTDFPTPNTTLTVDEKLIKLDDKSVLDHSTSDVWRYSAVVWDDENPSKDLSCKVKYDGKDVPQEKIIDETDTTCTSLIINERFRTNPGMNTLSMSVFGMRMLTAKAVIFNLIITLRLWSS